MKGTRARVLRRASAEPNNAKLPNGPQAAPRRPERPARLRPGLPSPATPEALTRAARRRDGAELDRAELDGPPRSLRSGFARAAEPARLFFTSCLILPQEPQALHLQVNATACKVTLVQAAATETASTAENRAETADDPAGLTVLVPRSMREEVKLAAARELLSVREWVILALADRLLASQSADGGADDA